MNRLETIKTISLECAKQIGNPYMKNAHSSKTILQLKRTRTPIGPLLEDAQRILAIFSRYFAYFLFPFMSSSGRPWKMKS
jgi:hypothetical protein